MSNLFVTFGGMSLILSGGGRSEALFISTTKAASPHQHKHTLTVGSGGPMELDDVLMWIEEDGQRLEGPLTDAATLLARLGDLTPRNGLLRDFLTPDPDNQTGWRSQLAIWFRLPGGDLETLPTDGPGGASQWEFPPFNGTPTKKRQLTQIARLKRRGVTGRVRVAIVHRPQQQIQYVDVTPDDRTGDCNIALLTEFKGDPPPLPTPGTQVHLDEMALVYRCVAGGQGPIPFVRSWPNTLVPANQGLKHSDPRTGICPIAGADI
jgi:hypothetical protein